MSKGIWDMNHSLVGGSIEFSFKRSISDTSTIDKEIECTRKRIEKDVESALSVGGEICVMLLAELTNFYLRKVYYMAIRGAIRMRRYRPAVIEYTKLDIDKRAEKLSLLLSDKSRGDHNRDLKVLIAKYFLSAYPNRLPEFKNLLNREEYIFVSSK